jgi:hypothetical protein
MAKFLLIKNPNPRRGVDPYLWLKLSVLSVIRGEQYGLDKFSHYHPLEGKEVIEDREAEDYPPTPTDRYRLRRRLKSVELHLTVGDVEDILHCISAADGEGLAPQNALELAPRLRQLLPK